MELYRWPVRTDAAGSNISDDLYQAGRATCSDKDSLVLGYRLDCLSNETFRIGSPVDEG